MNHVDLPTAEKLSGIAEYTIRRHIRKGDLQALQFSGGRYLIDINHLTDFAARYRARELDARFKKV